MKGVEDIKSKGALWPRDGRWEAAEPEELNIACGAARRHEATTELNINGVDTREIHNDEIFLNGTRGGTFWAAVTELDH